MSPMRVAHPPAAHSGDYPCHTEPPASPIPDRAPGVGPVQALLRLPSLRGGQPLACVKEADGEDWFAWGASGGPFDTSGTVLLDAPLPGLGGWNVHPGAPYPPPHSRPRWRTTSMQVLHSRIGGPLYPGLYPQAEQGRTGFSLDVSSGCSAGLPCSTEAATFDTLPARRRALSSRLAAVRHERHHRCPGSRGAWRHRVQRVIPCRGGGDRSPLEGRTLPQTECTHCPCHL